MAGIYLGKHAFWFWLTYAGCYRFRSRLFIDCKKEHTQQTDNPTRRTTVALNNEFHCKFNSIFFNFEHRHEIVFRFFCFDFDFFFPVNFPFDCFFFDLVTPLTRSAVACVICYFACFKFRRNYSLCVCVRSCACRRVSEWAHSNCKCLKSDKLSVIFDTLRAMCDWRKKREENAVLLKTALGFCDFFKHATQRLLKL